MAIERKAESNLRVKKDGDEVSVIFSDGKQRGPAIPEATAPRFRYCEEAGMHISCEAASIAKAEAAREAMREEVSEIFNTPGKGQCEEINAEYLTWMRQSIQLYANRVGQAVGYFNIATGDHELIIPKI